MILPALIDYYGRLEKDAEHKVPHFGFSREGISFCIVLEPDGTLADHPLVDLRESVVTNEKTGKTDVRPRQMIVPNRGGRSGTKLKPNFLWDNTGYVLGRDAKDNIQRSEEAFGTFRDYHLGLRDQIEDEGYQALCRFLETWDPASAESLPNWEEACGQNLAFQIRARQRFVHQIDALQEIWPRIAEAEADTAPGRSLIGNQTEELSKLHPQVQGVTGTNTTGASLVSFNDTAFTSYGKTQSYNAPVGLHEAFRYTTSFDELLSDREHRVRLGDSTVIFWSDRPTPFEHMFSFTIGDRAEDDQTRAQISGFFQALRQGRSHESLGDPSAPFYVLGLSPNASRISVRFWLVGTVQQFADRLARHTRDLEMAYAPPNAPPLMIRGILWETAREPKDIAPQLAGEIARAVLTGGPYPLTLLNAVIRRVRADRTLNHRRAAILKAVLTRNHEMEVPVSLQTDHPDPAYHLGRLFAALEKTQEDALGGQLNTTIKDSYFGTASATPAAVFPRLMRMHQHHIDKLEGGLKVNREILIQSICDHVEQFPPHLPLAKQGLFQIAYYHQRSEFFRKREDKADQSESNQSTEPQTQEA